jgi:hypothetical protein
VGGAWVAGTGGAKLGVFAAAIIAVSPCHRYQRGADVRAVVVFVLVAWLLLIARRARSCRCS